jgi:hypothetical protein
MYTGVLRAFEWAIRKISLLSVKQGNVQKFGMYLIAYWKYMSFGKNVCGLFRTSDPIQ